MKKYIFFALSLVLFSACTQPASELVILSTTDTHSQVEPLPMSSSRTPGMGGYARRMGMISALRDSFPDLLLFDSGDFSQGTPYFNFYHGRIEIEALNRMGYDAGTLGNHEFDNGIDTLAMVLRLAKFPIVVANYDVTGTPLEGLVKPYTVIRRAGHRIGVFGLGVAPNDLIGKKNFGTIRYIDPLTVINETASTLRQKEHCDVVICLSHLGSDECGAAGVENDYDMNLIPQTHGVDLFLSGHTHHLHNEFLTDADGHQVLMVQTGKSGAMLAKTTMKF